MIIRNQFLFLSFTVLAIVSACQSNTTGEPPVTAGVAGAGGNRPMGGAGGQAGGGHAAQAGVGANAGSPNAGSAGTSAGGTSGGSHAGGTSNGGANAGDTSGGSGGSHAGGTSAGSGGASAGSGGASDGEAGTGGGEAGSSGQSPREFAYFSGLFKGVTACELDLSGPAAGTPHVLQNPPVGSKHAIALTTDPAQRFLYVATNDFDATTDDHIDSYRIAADGTLPALPTSSIQTPSGMSSITIDPKGRFIYANGTFIFGYKIDGATGGLTAIAGPQPTGGSYVAADPTGNFVYVTEQGLRGYRIDQTSGALSQELPGSPFGRTGVPGDAVRDGAIVFKPSGDFLYTSGAGQGTGALNAFAIEAGTGKLSLLTGSPFSRDLTSDANASDIAMDPLGQYVYVTSFATRHVSGFAIAADGTLTAVPGPPPTAGAPYSVGVDPSGRFVYIGDDSGNNSVYALSRANGKLDEVMNSPFLFGGLQPEVSFAALP